MLYDFTEEQLAVGMLVALDAVAAPSAPLFEEEGGAMLFNLLFDVDDPIQQHGTGLGAALATHDNPVDATKVQLTQILNQRLAGEKFDAGIEFTEMVNTNLGIAALDGNTQPHVLRDKSSAEVFSHSFGTLGKDLVAVLGRVADGVHNTVDKLEGNVLVEDVAHGADEDVVGLAPLQRLIEGVLMERQLEAVAVFLQSHGFQSTGHYLGIAMRTAGGTFGATSDGVPRLVGPFYLGIFHFLVSWYEIIRFFLKTWS